MSKTLRSLREELGLSQQDVADRSGISRSYYTNIELGRKTPSLTVAHKIAQTLQTDMSIFNTVYVPFGNNLRPTGTERN